MSEKTTEHEDGHATLTCAACRAEVPESAAHTFEGEDYVQHFCGLDCLSSWKQNNGLEEKPGK